jgi:hypothetical protein
MIPGETVDAPSSGGEGVDDADAPHRAAATRLERAFGRHREREDLADCARVVVRDDDQGRYEYVDGVHYVTGIADDARERVEAFVDARDLDVVMDGTAGVAFRHDHVNVAADVHVAGVIVEAAFDADFTDLDDVVEIVDGTTEVSWTELDAQPA